MARSLHTQFRTHMSALGKALHVNDLRPTTDEVVETDREIRTAKTSRFLSSFCWVTHTHVCVFHEPKYAYLQICFTQIVCTQTTITLFANMHICNYMTGTFFGLGLEVWLIVFAPERLHRLWSQMKTSRSRCQDPMLDEHQSRTLVLDAKEGFASFVFFSMMQTGNKGKHWEVDLITELTHRGLSREGVIVLGDVGRCLPLRSFDIARKEKLQEIKEIIRFQIHPQSIACT